MGAIWPSYLLSSFDRTSQVGVCSVNRMVVKLAIAAAVATLFSFNPSAAQIIKPAPDQIIKPAPKAKQVEIIQGPTLESARDDMAIINGLPTTLAGTTIITRSPTMVRIPRS